MKKKHRGTGVGKLLVKESNKFVEENNLMGIRIKTLSSNKKWINHFISEGWKKEREYRLIGSEYVSLIRLMKPRNNSLVTENP